MAGYLSQGRRWILEEVDFYGDKDYDNDNDNGMESQAKL
jgi:hypothetical protein